MLWCKGRNEVYRMAPDCMHLFMQLSQEVSELHEKLLQRDIEYSTLAKQLAALEHQEAHLRAASTADTQAVRKQIAEMRDALRDPDIVGS